MDRRYISEHQGNSNSQTRPMQLEGVSREQQQLIEHFEKLGVEDQKKVIQDTIHEMMVDHLTYFQTAKDLTELPFRDPEGKNYLERRDVTQEKLTKHNYTEVKRVKEESSKMIQELIADIEKELIDAARKQDALEKKEYNMEARVMKELEDARKLAQHQTHELERKLAQALDKDVKVTDIEVLTLSTHLDAGK